MNLVKTVFAAMVMSAAMAQAQAPTTATTATTAPATATAPTAAAGSMNKADKQAALANDTAGIKAACGTELTSAPACQNETAGHGLIMCLNKNVGKAITPGCRSAMKSAHGQMESMKH